LYPSTGVPQFGQNYDCVSIEDKGLGRHGAIYPVFGVPGTKSVLLESTLALDNSHAITRESPEIALLGTDAAVALAGRLDLGDLELEDEGTTMAVATV
jgi:hypothetical protein